MDGVEEEISMRAIMYGIVAAIVVFLLVLNAALLMQLRTEGRALSRCVSQQDMYVMEKYNWRQDYFECTDNFHSALNALKERCPTQECPVCERVQQSQQVPRFHFYYLNMTNSTPPSYEYPNNVIYLNDYPNDRVYVNATPVEEIYANLGQFEKGCMDSGPCM
jgi:hypothetical protein